MWRKAKIRFASKNRLNEYLEWLQDARNIEIDANLKFNYYILHQEFPKAQDKSLGRRSWALPKTCNFRSWALSWAQSTKNDKSTLTTFFSGLVPKTNDTPLERFNNLNYLETWFMPGCPPWPLVVWLLELWCKGCFAKLFNSFCMEPT